MGSISGTTTSRFFDAAAAAGPRRSTRLSLARFAYDSTFTDAAEGNADAAELSFGSDIEDAITKSSPARRQRNNAPSTAATTTGSTTRKRKRTATTTSTSTELKTEVLSIKTEDSTTPSPAAKPRRERKPARPKKDPSTGETSVEPPSDWEEMYALVKEMRLTGPAANAAVDTMGCERLASPEASPRDRRFHTLIALMLSSQTKDTVNAAAMARLKAELPPCREGAEAGLNLENVLAVEPAVLNGLIYGVGFHNNKTKYIKQTAEILRDKFGSDIPGTIEGLTSLPGVGPKMAHLCMSAPNGWDRVEGIGVDVHVHRITNLWGWNKTSNPEGTRAALESWLPRDRWREINWLLVGFGQAVCLPVGRRCGDCELGARGLCRAADRKKVAEGRRRREMAVVSRLEAVKAEGWKAEMVKEEEDEEEEPPLESAVIKMEEGDALEEDKVVIKDQSRTRPIKRR